MSEGKTFFDKAVELNDSPVKNGLCSICKGAHRLCGKDRCPLMIKFYSQQRTMPLIDMALRVYFDMPSFDGIGIEAYKPL